MRLLSIIVLSLFSSACAAPVSPREYNATVAWVGCEKRAAAQLDDGRSDPFSIAIAVDSACASSKQAFFAAETADMNYIGESTIRPQFEAMTMKAATEIVMRHRKGLD